MVAQLKRLGIACVNLLTVVALVAGGWWAWPYASRYLQSYPWPDFEAILAGGLPAPRHPLSGLMAYASDRLNESQAGPPQVRPADDGRGRPALAPLAASESGPAFGATETFRAGTRGRLMGARWSRLVFWWTSIQPGGPRDWRTRDYLPDDLLRREQRAGIQQVGLLINTPAWAAEQPAQAPHSAPKGLALPFDHPDNAWGRFARRIATEYRGRIDHWIIWNEPDITAQDPNARYYTWAGDEQRYYLLLKTAYRAIKAANSRATVIFAATTYWTDVTAGRPLYLGRVLGAAAQDPEAGPNGFFFDAVALNLYSSPDDVARIAGEYRAVLAGFGLEKPLWLTEANALPEDDGGQAPAPGALQVSGVTMDLQASYVMQTLSMALAAGYQRVAIHAAADHTLADGTFGLVRRDGTLRPAFVAYQVIARYLGQATRYRFAPLERPRRLWPPSTYHPNWQVYRVVADGAGGRRVSVLWNGDGTPLLVTVPKSGPQALLYDKYGRSLPVEAGADGWQVVLPAATAQAPQDPPGYHFIGGDPLLLVEEGVPEGADIPPLTSVPGV